MAQRNALTSVVVVTRKRYTFWITDVQAAGLKRVEDAEGTSESEQIRQALNEWLTKKGAIESGLRRVSPRRMP
jgi:hypothetical protein